VRIQSPFSIFWRLAAARIASASLRDNLNASSKVRASPSGILGRPRLAEFRVKDCIGFVLLLRLVRIMKFRLDALVKTDV